MAFVPAPGVVMAELVYSYQSQICENTLYFERLDDWTPTNMTVLAEALAAWWEENIQANVTSALSLTSVRVTDLSTQTSLGIEYIGELPESGGAAGDPLPNSVTAAVTFVTDIRGRSFRGRNYILGLLESQVSGNFLSSGTVSFFTDAYTLLIDVAADADCTWVVLSRYSDNAPRVTAVATPITGVRMNQVVDSQRRRLPGRGQ